jgi:hypothetical protein
VAACLSANVTGQAGVLSSNLRGRSPHYQLMQIAHIAFDQRRFLPRQFAHITDSVVVIERLKVIFKRFSAYRNPLFDDKRGFNRAERIALDSIRCIGKLNIVVMLKVGERLRRQGP